jgi:phosphoglycerate kinase
MKVVTAQDVLGKKVLLRMDIDVPIKDGKVLDPFRIDAGIPTLKLCLESASEVIVLGHIGRPEGKEISALSVEPIWNYLEVHGFGSELHLGKLKLLENLRFELGEDDCDEAYAKTLADLGDVYVNEAFASAHKSASTTMLPQLLPSYVGLRFSLEVEKLLSVKQGPEHPLVVIIGGAKIEDKLGVVETLSHVADHILLGGKLPVEIMDKGIHLPNNVWIAELGESGEDIAAQTIQDWSEIIQGARMIVWNGPMGKFEEYNNSETKNLAELILKSNAKTIVGGGDTLGALTRYNLLDQFSTSTEAGPERFVSTGGGAMLKILENGTLPTIDALNSSDVSSS